MTTYAKETDVDRLQRKANQHWEMAGLARQDGDKTDAHNQTNLAREAEARIKELIG